MIVIRYFMLPKSYYENLSNEDDYNELSNVLSNKYPGLQLYRSPKFKYNENAYNTENWILLGYCLDQYNEHLTFYLDICAINSLHEDFQDINGKFPGEKKDILEKARRDMYPESHLKISVGVI
jgi:hypothetical protein